jgi:hypothetical protein
MANFELRQLVGQRKTIKGEIREVAWPMDIVLMNGKQIATINRVPGAPIGLLLHAALSESQKEALANVVAAARGGVRPVSIKSPVTISGEFVEEEEDYSESPEE